MATPSNKRPADGSSRSPRASLSELLLREGAPWRPFEEEGVLVASEKAARAAKEIHACSEHALVTQLKTVCSWPERQRNTTWRIGDYSFYILEFEPNPGVLVYAQFWSDPDSEDVTFEVSSGAWNPPADRYVDAARQDLIRDHGFEVGGTAGNFRKKVRASNARELKAIARETIAILCKAMGYDGRQDLRYKLHLGTSARQAYVFTSLAPDQMVSLCAEWGFVAKMKPRKEGQLPVLECRHDSGSFGMLLAEREADEDSFRAIALRTFLKVPKAEDDDGGELARLRAVNGITQTVTGLQASMDEDGDLQLEATIYLHGGVTADHIHMRIQACV